MSIKGAFDRIAAWTVTGVTVLGLDDFAGPIGEADLPALIPFLSGTGGEAFKPFGVTVEAGKVVVHVDHKLVVCGLGLELLQERQYNVLDLVDKYLAVVVDDFYLNGNLLEPLTIADTRAEVIDIGNVLYWGVTFRHRWVLKVT